MSEAPHVPAAFINAIREEGTKGEACDYLQTGWNELCQAKAHIRQLEAEVARLREALELYADPTGYTDANGEQYPADAETHPGLAAAHTLAQGEHTPKEE